MASSIHYKLEIHRVSAKTTRTLDTTSSRIPLWVILLSALILRLIAATLMPDQTPHVPDSLTYRALGHQLWQGNVFGTPYFMPLYPALVGVLGPGWAQMLADIAISTVMVWLVFELALAVFYDKNIALVAALGAAVYPPFIYFSFVGLTETLFTTLILAAYVCWYRGAFVTAAVFAVLSILTRPAIDLLAPLLAIYFAAVIHRFTAAAILRQFFIYAAIYCALMTPWWIHNYAAYGAFVRLNLAAGENFYAGNNPLNTSGGAINGVDFDDTAYRKITDPVERNRVAFSAAVEFVRQDPKAFLQRATVKFVRFWRLWPYASDYSDWRIVVIYATSYVPIFLLALAYFGFWGGPEFFRIAPILAFAGYLTLVNVVFVASLRYRFPLEPFMIVVAAAALIRLMRRWSAIRPTLTH
jgi:hypothetical protein